MLTAMTLSAILTAAPAKSAEITVYNGGFALVKEVREVNLKSGRQDLMVENVAQMLEPTSVAIRSLTSAGSFSVLEQNYRYDLVSVQAILEKSVGQQITLHRVLPNGQKEQIKGTLMSAPSAIVGGTGGTQMVYTGMVIQSTDGRILLSPSGEISIDTMPEGLISKPTLVWDLDAKAAGKQDIELSYLTGGMGWQADYVLSLDAGGKIGDLRAWVTLNNNSGATFKDAKLKLLAGDVERARQNYGKTEAAGAPQMAAARSDMRQEQFGDYHLYTLERPATVRNNEIKQVSMFEAFNVPVKRQLVANLTRGYEGWRATPDDFINPEVRPSVLIVFKNDKASKLGMPMPEGTFKVFMRDSSGSPQLLGENRIQHTPKDEVLRLEVGRAFDVIIGNKRTSFTYIRSGNKAIGTKETFEIEVRNRKDSDDTVMIRDSYWGEFNITSPGNPFTKLNSNVVEWAVPVKANSTKTVTYTVETKW